MGRGRTAPSTARRAHTVWSGALGIEWPITDALVTSEITAERHEEPEQAPAMDLETVRKIELIATNKKICMYKRAYAAAIIVMTYASLRFADVQKLRTFERNDDSVPGTLSASKTKEQHGLNWPLGFPTCRCDRINRLGPTAVGHAECVPKGERNRHALHVPSPRFYVDPGRGRTSPLQDSATKASPFARRRG